jgi:hypothetical protein
MSPADGASSRMHACMHSCVRACARAWWVVSEFSTSSTVYSSLQRPGPVRVEPELQGGGQPPIPQSNATSHVRAASEMGNSSPWVSIQDTGLWMYNRRRHVTEPRARSGTRLAPASVLNWCGDWAGGTGMTRGMGSMGGSVGKLEVWEIRLLRA